MQVKQKLTAQWSHRNSRKPIDHLLTGLLYGRCGQRMMPTHATKAGIRYRYYVSAAPIAMASQQVLVDLSPAFQQRTLKGHSLFRSVNEHLLAQHEPAASGTAHAARSGVMIAE